MDTKITITISKDWLPFIAQGLFEISQPPRKVYLTADDYRHNDFHLVGNVGLARAREYFAKLYNDSLNEEENK